MELIIISKHTEVPDAVQEYARRKLGRLSRYLPDITEAKAEFSRENTRSGGERHVVQVTLAKKGTILRGEERATEVMAAIDAVADVMQRQIERYKGRHSRGKGPASGSQPPTLFSNQRLVKVKRFPMKPMSLEEAVEQMELLGHTFFVFYQEEGQLQVLYKRQDGDYGLIVPELS